jgi:mannosyltransferase OCH1-like enzyme
MNLLTFFLMISLTFSPLLYAHTFEEQLRDERFITGIGLSYLHQIKERFPELYPDVQKKLSYLHEHYEQSKALEVSETTNATAIPKIVHFIWIGPNEIPHVDVFQLWHEKNPEYRLILWTDRARKLLLPYVELRDIGELFPLKLAKEFSQSRNYAEQSDMLRLEILERYGGIYSDIDAYCRASTDSKL